MSNRIFCYDTEFLEDGKSIELISIGIVCDDGTEYYAVNADMDAPRVYQHPWLRDNVWPKLPVIESNEIRLAALDRTSTSVRPKWVIANEVREFITGCIELGDRPQLWANYGAYDHVALAWLYGPMIELPKGIPMFTHDLQQLREGLPPEWKPPRQPAAGVHNALEDARYNLRMYAAMTDSLRGKAVKGY